MGRTTQTPQAEQTDKQNAVDTALQGSAQKAQKKGKRKLLGIFCLLFAVLLLPLSLPSTYAKYQSKFSGSSTVQVAAFVFEGTQEMHFSPSALKPGQSCTYEFQVTNQKESKVCEVALEYTLAVSSLGNLPLSYTLESTGVVGTGSVPATLSEKGVFPHSVQSTHSYTLTVTWDGAETDPTLATEMDLITLTIEGIQRRPQTT